MEAKLSGELAALKTARQQLQEQLASQQAAAQQLRAALEQQTKDAAAELTRLQQVGGCGMGTC